MTINDLDKPNFIQYKEFIYKKRQRILLKYFDTKEIQAMKSDGYPCKWLFGEKKFTRPNVRFHDSDIRYSARLLRIPIDFDCVMTVVLEKDLTTTGIFRISTNYVQLEEVEAELLRLVAMNLARDDLLDYLRKYDIVLLTTLFSRLFTHYNTTLFPKRLLKIAIKANNIEDEEDKYSILKVILLSFPFTKRTMFESVAKFIKTVSEANVEGDSSNSRSMTVNGVCKVLAPRIFISNNDKLQIQDLFECIEMLDYVFAHMPNIIEIDDF